MSVEDRDERIADLFAHTRELPTAEQEQFLLDKCDDEQLRGEVLALLVAYRDAPKADVANPILPKNEIIRGYEAAGLGDTEAAGRSIGATVGRYKLLQKLGEGGMGTVYMADQKLPVSRRVALKLIRPGMDSGEILARFEAERQALAMMDHPNIAKILDAGETPSGQPYFVMELIHGLPFTEYCNQQRLTIRERLDLFIPICEAVAHAHQKAIIHRDLKPSNILVAEYDHRPVPKIIDFGIAKAVSQKLTEKTLFTQYGQLIGTMEYMSPEQSKLNQLDIDTRSDIYSLGVILYELLSGTTPFDRERLRSAAFDEVLRIIREEEPPTPSSRITSSHGVGGLSQSRKTQSNAVSRLVRGDLDWITLKALSKERRDRYQTAIDLSKDIERHIEDRPIEARRPSFMGRVQRYVRRNKLATSFMAATVAAGILGVVALYGRVRVSKLTAVTAETKLELGHAELLRTRAEQDTKLAQAKLETERRHLKRINKLSHLTSQARTWRSAKPEESILRGIESIRYSRVNENVLLPLARETLLNSVSRLGGLPLTIDGTDFYDVAMTSRWLVTRSWHNAEVKLWDIQARNPFATTPSLLHEKKAASMETSHDGSRMVTAGDGLYLWRLDAKEPELLAELSTANYEKSHIGLSPNGQWLVVREHGGAVKAWDLTATPPTSRSAGHMPGYKVSGRIFITNDGRWVALSVEVEVDEQKSRYARQLWDLHHADPKANALTLYEELPDSEWVRLLAISSDGRWLATHMGEGF